MAPIYLGGCVRAIVEKARKGLEKNESDPGILAASGLVAGEGLAGVLVAGLVAAKVAPKSMDPRIAGASGELLAAAMVVLIGIFLYWSARSAKRATK
jgi:hypothetical protein